MHGPSFIVAVDHHDERRRVAQASEPWLASVLFRGSTADAQEVLHAAVARVLGAVDGAYATDAGRSRWARELALPEGARMAISVARPAQPRMHLPETLVLTGQIDPCAALSPALRHAALCAIRHHPLTDLELAHLRTHVPLLSSVQRLVPQSALTTVAPMMVVHHMLDFIAMVEAVVALGEPPDVLTVLDKGYAYTHTERVDAHLRAMGVRVWPWQQAAEALDDHAQRALSAGRRPLLIDDGGYTLPVLLTELPDLAPIYVDLAGPAKLKCR